jgi:hypothetical protein
MENEKLLEKLTAKLSQAQNQRSQHRRAAAFGAKLPDLLNAIDHNQHRFSRRPIGPLGLHVRVPEVHKQWATAIDACIGHALGLFLVATAEDKTIMNELRRSVGCRNEGNCIIVTALDQDQQEQDECPICFDRLAEVPKETAQCGHVFCVACSAKVFGRRSRTKGPPASCPMCLAEPTLDRPKWKKVVTTSTAAAAAGGSSSGRYGNLDLPMGEFRDQTIANLIEVDNDEVFNALIDQTQMEQKIVCRDRNEIYSKIFLGNAPKYRMPQNIQTAFLPDGSRMFIRNGSEVYQSARPARGDRLTCEYDSARSFEEQIAVRQRELVSCQITILLKCLG